MEPQHISEVIAEVLAQIKPFDIPLTRQQAAVYLGVCPHTIDNYRAQGRLKLVSNKGLTGYFKEDLDKLRK